jgi:hypothetical protein
MVAASTIAAVVSAGTAKHSIQLIR